ncbi:hypothetical protein CONLIGDRAFT_552219, partial [Coniochaeta ligniaria NRRL 30616]
MGTTYQVPNMASYENNHVHHSAYASKLGHAERTRGALGDSIYDATTRYSTSQEHAHQPQYQQAYSHHQQQTQPQRHTRASHSTTNSQPSTSRPPTRPTTPSSAMSGKSQSDAATAARDAAMVLHNLQIPTCISPNGGDLADFTAQITCLFWFESIQTLEAAENIGSLPPNTPPARLTENALPLPSFKKWVHTVLSTTQVTQNVIILALMFIYRLKVKNPVVKGRSGSEYRLLTVALMLGNKFLDDNTYTNKTWAEVSGISVTEIHVMEVEFLSNMRYGLLASKEEWEEWLVKLAKFWEYCEHAQRPAPSPLVLPSTGHRSSFVSPLPSPTGMLPPAGYQTPQALHTYSPTSNAPLGSSNAPWPTVYQQSSATSPLALKPVLQGYRKRGYADEDPTEPPPKRMSRHQLPSQSQPQLPGQDLSYQASEDQSRRFVPSSAATSESLRLPVPSLSLNTNTQSLPSGLTQASAGQYATHQPSALSLPPLVPGVRAMSTVFPPSATTFAPQLPVLGSTGPSIPPLSVPSITPTASFPPSNYGTPTKRLSPQSALTPGAGAYASSPLTDSFGNHNLTPMGNMGNGSGVRTPISNSPSIYLQQRPSPYKPVRHVNTLLYPPPSAFLHEYHISNAVPPTQMHYQPLGRRNEFRTGVVPEFAMARNNLFHPGQHHGLP